MGLVGFDNIRIGFKDDNGSFHELDLSGPDDTTVKVLDKQLTVPKLPCIDVLMHHGFDRQRGKYLRSLTRFKSVHEHNLKPPKLSKWGN